ncbi:hypothetical protein GCM10009569_03750 [Arthrobacter russicus]|uniref:HNH endonuclease n=1 Tax=Arthrobacter russicus TaxID=172040 RepID=A0ABU1JDV8_9MICC|nr:hypothetical protein [Arthrobacter russicus]
MSREITTRYYCDAEGCVASMQPVRGDHFGWTLASEAVDFCPNHKPTEPELKA